MRLGALVLATVAGIVYANDPAPVAFDAGEWYATIPLSLWRLMDFATSSDPYLTLTW